ncbi:MAG: bis(5'-nucleosyl)-tetraphosphatase (symmetrical) YqeK [Lachnospiraceae bacterium]
MDREQERLIKKKLKKRLTKDRYIHTLGVANTCVSLAMSLGTDLDRAYMAGLLHDCAKCIPDDEKIAKCERHNIEIADIERKSPYLLHTKLGAHIALNKFGVTDEEILSAILCHTTGKPEMTELELILFVADYIEPGRDRAPRLKEIRMEAFRDIKHAAYMILKDTLSYLEQKGNPIDDMTVKTFNYYKTFFE